MAKGYESSPWLTIPAVLVIIAVTGVGAVIVLAWLRPGQDNAQLVTEILGFLGIVLNLIKTQEVHNLTNSRMTQLGETIGREQYNMGKEAGRKEEDDLPRKGDNSA